jgi:hypothetical protein
MAKNQRKNGRAIAAAGGVFALSEHWLGAGRDDLKLFQSVDNILLRTSANASPIDRERALHCSGGQSLNNSWIVPM